MVYSLEAADLLTKQVDKFISLNCHQLVGHIANLDFWMEEVRHALALLDGYRERFEKMTAAHDRYVKMNRVVNFDLGDRGIQWTPRLNEIDQQNLLQARKRLVAGWERFIARCQKEHQMNERNAQRARDVLGNATDEAP